jgi:hypothetical protein
MTWQLRYGVRFEVHGQEHSATLTTRSTFSETEGTKLLAWAAKHTRGDRIAVRYDPSRPDRAIFAAADVPNNELRTRTDLQLAMVAAIASVSLLVLAKHLRSREPQIVHAANTDNLSPAGRIALGILVAALGLFEIGAAVTGAIHAAAPLTSAAFIAVPAGLIFVFGGALLGLPPGSTRWQRPLAALLITSFALTLDWIAFGPGERQFGGGISLGFIGAGFQPGELVGRAVFGVAALILDLFTVLMWVAVGRGVVPPRSGKADQGSELDSRDDPA